MYLLFFMHLDDFCTYWSWYFACFEFFLDNFEIFLNQISNASRISRKYIETYEIESKIFVTYFFLKLHVYTLEVCLKE